MTTKIEAGQALGLIPKLKQYPLGAILGLVGAAVANIVAPDLTPDGWMEAPFTLSCVAAGILIERSLHYFLGWYVDPRIHHLAASREARIQLAKLREYEKAGVIGVADARRIAARIAVRDVAGGLPLAYRPRGSYQKRVKVVIASEAKQSPVMASAAEAARAPSARGGKQPPPPTTGTHR